MKQGLGIALLALAMSIFAIAPAAAEEGDRHEGYYYPKPAEVEVYKARSKGLEEADRRHRIGFVVGVVNATLERPYPPPVAVFAKGAEAEKLIIVSNVEGRLDTIYRVRAYLATLTSSARMTPIFREYHVEDWFTFFDLANMLGFKQITVSDGDKFAHQILLE